MKKYFLNIILHKKKTVIFLCLYLLIENSATFSQNINVNSISTARQTGGDNGYTLDGIQMTYSRAKLLNSNNFGASGIYHKGININDGYSTSGSLTQISSIPTNEIFFFGGFNKNDASLQPFTEDEIDSLYKWSLSGGKLIIGANPDMLPFCNSSILNDKWGYDLVQTNCTYYPTVEGSASDIFNGPFGNVPSVSEGGSLQGFFNSFPANSIILAEEAYGNPTLFLDCNTLDLIAADVDVFTTLGGISGGVGISNTQDMFWANVFVYMDKLQNPPVITNNGAYLTCMEVYSNYQWYLNGNTVSGANSRSYTAEHNGTYTVLATLDCGCNIFSNEILLDSLAEYECGEIFVPSAFSPNGDGRNDTLKVYGNCIIQMELKIYDRWGEQVFESNEQAIGWDGNFRGKPFNTDVFVYYLKAEEKDGSVVKLKGNVTLMR